MLTFCEGMLTPPSGGGWCRKARVAGWVTWSGCLRELGAVGPCGGFVVVAAVLEAAVQDAGEAAGDAAHRVVVAGVVRAELVEYVRNGTLSIIAALQPATGQVVTEPIEHNDPVTFTGFLQQLDQCTDPARDIHLVMDNGPSHTSAATRAWIAAHPPDQRHLHPQTRLLAGHGRASPC